MKVDPLSHKEFYNKVKVSKILTPENPNSKLYDLAWLWVYMACGQAQ